MINAVPTTNHPIVANRHSLQTGSGKLGLANSRRRGREGKWLPVHELGNDHGPYQMKFQRAPVNIPVGFKFPSGEPKRSCEKSPALPGPPFCSGPWRELQRVSAPNY